MQRATTSYVQYLQLTHIVHTCVVLLICCFLPPSLRCNTYPSHENSVAQQTYFSLSYYTRKAKDYWVTDGASAGSIFSSRKNSQVTGHLWSVFRELTTRNGITSLDCLLLLLFFFFFFFWDDPSSTSLCLSSN